MRVSKNIHKGGRITDLNQLIAMAKDKKAVIVVLGGHHFIRPAAFMINWSVAQLSKTQLFYAIHESDITNPEFE